MRDRFAGLCESDLRRQCYLVQAALDSVKPMANRTGYVHKPLPEAGSATHCQDLIDMATEVGERLVDLAIWHQGRAFWFQLAPVTGDLWSLKPSDSTLYSGLSGIALFLAYLGSVTGTGRYMDLAMAAHETSRAALQASPEVMSTVGAFTGWGGIIYTHLHLASLWQAPSLLQEARDTTARLAPLIARDQRFDVIDGAAGGLACLLQLARYGPSAASMDAAIACGDHLLSHAEWRSGAMAWPAPDGGQRPLTGFSHGAAGIAWSLAQLAAASGLERFREAAISALAYERRWFSPEHGNWPDLRGQPGQNGEWEYVNAWCHGAAGIALGRLGMRRHVQDEQIDADIATALRTTLAQGFGASHCLCHGDLGNLDLLLKASEVFQDTALQQRADGLGARILAGIQRDGWRCGASIGSEVLGLMPGLAGIGYGLLRAAVPAQIPSMLLLEPPCSSAPLSDGPGAWEGTRVA